MSWFTHMSTTRVVTIGTGDFNPPDDSCDYYRDTTEIVCLFDRFVIRNGEAWVRETLATVDSETHRFIRRGRKVERPACFLKGSKAGPWFLKYCARHPRKGPQLLAIAAAAGVEVPQ